MQGISTGPRAVAVGVVTVWLSGAIASADVFNMGGFGLLMRRRGNVFLSSRRVRQSALMVFVLFATTIVNSAAAAPGTLVAYRSDTSELITIGLDGTILASRAVAWEGVPDRPSVLAPDLAWLDGTLYGWFANTPNDLAVLFTVNSLTGATAQLATYDPARVGNLVHGEGLAAKNGKLWASYHSPDAVHGSFSNWLVEITPATWTFADYHNYGLDMDGLGPDPNGFLIGYDSDFAWRNGIWQLGENGSAVGDYLEPYAALGDDIDAVGGHLVVLRQQAQNWEIVQFHFDATNEIIVDSTTPITGLSSSADMRGLAVIPEPVLPGDLDGDGFVGISDLNIVLANWNQYRPTANPLADPSGDGFVGIDDLDIVLGNWNTGTPPESIIIPEPASLSLLALGGIGLLIRGRRRGTSFRQ